MMISERLRTAARNADLITPCYIFDLAGIEATASAMIKAWREEFPHFTLAYSVKTNPLSAITTRLRSLGAAAEVVSGAELDAALGDGFTPDQIYFDGPVKLPAEISHAVTAGVAIQADSLAEVDSLISIAAQGNGMVPRVALRLAVPLGRGRWSRFGLLPAEVATARAALAAAGVPVRGVHFNTGQHPLDAKPYQAVLRTWKALLCELCSMADEPLLVDIGGGFPAASCAPGVKLPPWSVYSRGVAAECRALGLPPDDLHLVIEPGRSLVEDHAILVTCVAVTKRRGRRSLAIVDAGTNLARSINGWHHAVEFLRPGDTRYDIYGAMCYESDLFREQVPGPADLAIGDRVIIGAVGGYDIPSANVWVRPRPPVYALISNGLQSIREPGSGIR